MFPEMSQSSQENACVGVSFFFLNKVAGLSMELYQERDSGTGVFLWILRNFWERLFLQNAPLAASKRAIWFSDKGLRERERERKRERKI